MNKEYFYMVKDPRVLGKVKHQLEDVLRLVLFFCNLLLRRI